MNNARIGMTDENAIAMPGRRHILSAGVGLTAATLLTPSFAKAQEGGPKVSGGPEETAATSESLSKMEQEVIELSKNKWLWMAERNIDKLNALFHEASVFVHMGGSMSKEQELNVIRSGRIQYKNADIKETSVRFIDATAILLSRIRLIAVVGGNEVVNPFMVTEVYVRQGDTWTLGSLSFTRLMGE